MRHPLPAKGGDDLAPAAKPIPYLQWLDPLTVDRIPINAPAQVAGLPCLGGDGTILLDAEASYPGLATRPTRR